MADGLPVIALDVGGTSVKYGLVDAAGTARDTGRAALDSSGPAEAILGTLAGCVRSLAGRAGAVAGLALAFPGPFDYAAGVCRIRGVAKFESLYGLDIGRELAARAPIPPASIVFLNDAEAAIGGEARHGAGRPHRRLVGVTLGTGLGSGLFADGVRVTSGDGVPANGGWLFDQPFGDDVADACFSIRGLRRRLAASGASSVEPERAAEAARDGDDGARIAFQTFGRDLAVFLAPHASRFGAESILVAGGLAGAFDLFGPSLAAGLRIPVARGTLGMAAPLLGAADAFRARARAR